MRLVVIGHGMVGHRLLESLAENGSNLFEITVLCEEPRAAYDRVNLSALFSGRSAEELSLVESGFFDRPGIRLELSETAVRIEPGVLSLFAVYDRDQPTHVTVMEIYADETAYHSHLQTPHFIKYKETTKDMVKSLELVDAIPIGLASKLPAKSSP